MLLGQGADTVHAGNPAEAALALGTPWPSGHSSNAVTLLGTLWAVFDSSERGLKAPQGITDGCPWVKPVPEILRWPHAPSSSFATGNHLKTGLRALQR